VLLKVHTSNFRIVGFTEDTSIGSLAALARETELPLVVDWGSGDLVDLAPLGLDDELPVLEVLDAGADLVTFSGDKLLGGPQAGFVVGRGELIARLRRDPLARVCRLDRLMIAAMHATLSAYVRGRAMQEVPTLRMLAATPEEIGRRAKRLKREVAKRTGLGRQLRVVEGVSRTGGGSSPTGERPTFLLVVDWPDGDGARLERRLRAGTPPVIGRVQQGSLLLDLRTVFPEQDALLADRVAEELLGASGD
jgi:L-seryl-tRNA(Ser) seleniumtransferase